MITKVSTTPCWVVSINSEGDEGHFPTEKKAVEYADKYGSEYGGPRQLPVPCWTATCDTKTCDEVEGDEDGDAIHIPALHGRHAAADLTELVRVGRGLQCPTCRDKTYPPVDPTQPPAIVTHDDVARLIGIVAALSDQISPWRDPATHQFVSRFNTMTTRVLTANAMSVTVRPFALQPLLPDMPTAAATTEVAR
ncbi:hypothetical protein ABZS29_38425 [Kribbella sp. NPDC005582]|uniref:hypothetical protein n=1 Tax=Kribbella sp. NPDC005582 TaxID=3156893 RepID=UPI0033B29CF5